MATQLGFLGYTALQSLVLCAVFVALCDICKRALRLDDLLAFCAAVLALGVLGYAAFWAAYANYRLFALLKIAALAVLIIHFGAMAWRRRLGDYRWLVEPLLFTFLFFIAVVTLGFSAGGIDDPATTAQNRFSHPLPIDNLLPLIVSAALKLGQIPSPHMGDWLTSDRPPLQTGLYLLLTLQNRPLAYQIVSSWLQATYLLGAWGLAVACALPTAARRLTLLACCLLPTAVINTFFVWPKMLAVGYLLLVFALLFCRSPQNDTERKVFGILIGGLTALAVLAHGSSAFALIGFAFVVLAFWAWPPLKTMIWGCAVLVALYVPWMLFQNFIDPPGNRLLKWHLAGVIDVDERSFLTALRDSYGALSWHDYLQGRLVNVITMIGSWPGNLRGIVSVVLRQDAAGAVGVRSDDFFQLLPSLHFFSIALICGIALLVFGHGGSPSLRKIGLRLLLAVVGSCAALVILIFIPGQTINHVGSYATQVILTAFAFMVLSVRARWLAIVLILMQAASVGTVYAFTVPHNRAQWLLLAICLASIATLIGYSLSARLATILAAVPPNGDTYPGERHRDGRERIGLSR